MSDAQTISEAESFGVAESTAKPDAGESQGHAAEAPSQPNKGDDWGDWDGPGYVKQWKKPSQSAIRELRRLDAENKYLPAVLKEVEERYDYTGKNQAEFDKYRKRFDPYGDVIGSLEQRFALQGVHPAAGLQQMAAVSDLLQRDPDQAYSMLLSAFQPRDAKALINSLAQRAGIDIGSLAADKPWIDPAVQNLIAPLQSKFDALLNMQHQQYQHQYHTAAQQVTSSIKAFKEATDDNGNLKYPHVDRLEGAMAHIVRTLHARGVNDIPPLEKLYEEARWADPELREEAIEERARRSESKAIQDARQSQASVEEATRASRNISGSKTAPTPPKFKNDKDAFMDTWDKLSRK